ncbi:MAG: hypothetical protein AAF497_07650 [Planctomycetota bacterium]
MRFATSILFLLLTVSAVTAQTVSTTLMLAPANDPVNVIDLQLSAGALGSDSDTSEFSGTIDVEFELANVNGSYDVTGLTFTGGLVQATDVAFSLLFGAVTADAVDMAATPYTVTPPGAASNGTFNSMDHGIEINQGMVVGPGIVMDFATMPFSGEGSGTNDGLLTLTPGSPVPGADVLDVEMSFPVELFEVFTIPDVPIFGDVDADFTATGTIVANGTIHVDTNSTIGDYNADGMLGCEDIDALGAAIRSGSNDSQFDLDGNGSVDSDDYSYWVTSVRGTVIGDANLDGQTDVSDFNLWNANRFTSGTGWCSGDFNGDGTTDVLDFNLWNANKFTAADGASPASVPEPTGQILVLLAIAFGSMILRANFAS